MYSVVSGGGPGSRNCTDPLAWDQRLLRRLGWWLCHRQGSERYICRTPQAALLQGVGGNHTALKKDSSTRGLGQDGRERRRCRRKKKKGWRS